MSVANLKDGGTFYRSYFLARELVKRGHEVVVFCISADSRFVVRHAFVDGVQVIECPNLFNRPVLWHGVGPIDILFRTLSLARKRFDIVHGFDYFVDVVWPTLLTRPLTEHVFISDWSDWYSKGVELGRFGRFRWPARLIGCLEDSTRRWADAVTVISDALRQRAVQLGTPPERLLHITNGAPSDVVKPLSKSKARAKLGINSRAKIVGYLGVYYTQDLDLLVEPMTHLCRRIPQLRLMTIGKLNTRAEALFHQNGLGEHLIVPGWVPWEELSLYLGAVDVFVLPMRKNAYNESRWPGKIGEYLAAGRPILASDVGEARRVVRDSEIGYRWDNTSEDFAEKLMRILGDASLAQNMGCRARELAEGEYSWRVRGERIEKFYNEVLGT
ncbi:glycosyltransferase family 4 protein [Acidobacteria bacterium AH-259-D05]|nr:glycosyltransferase family 4 protein [Acidobacteria bacterium AH-259-D05]